ncbi:MAG: glycosyltransferase [Candidatus Methylomirabilis oxyfera]|nr:glycosyltransferase [Candidatus Methylomirabilis oxyfera]
MRFVLVGPAAPLRGGIAIDNDALAQALRQAGHTVEQVSFCRLYPALLFPGRSQYDIGKNYEHSQAQHCIDSINPLSWWRAARTISRLQPQMVTFQWWHPFFAPCYATIMTRLRRTCPNTSRILISHNTRPHEPISGQDTALRLVVRRCDGVVVRSRSEYELITTVAPGTAVRIANYPLLGTSQVLPDREEAQHRLGVSGRVLLFFGYIRKYKGLDLLLRALALVPVDLGVTLLVAGEFYEPVESYRALGRALGIAERIRIIDRYIGEREWPELFAATDALVLPYVAASQSMSITLAYAFGKPVIVTRVGGLAEEVEEGRTGLIAEPEPAALAAAIQRLYNELLPSPYQAHIQAKRRGLGWDPFLRLLEGWQDRNP